MRKNADLKVIEFNLLYLFFMKIKIDGYAFDLHAKGPKINARMYVKRVITAHFTHHIQKAKV